MSNQRPTPKAPSIEALLTQMTGISRHDAAAKRICVVCKQPVTGFKDALSQKEYTISGMCQECQDSVFG